MPAATTPSPRSHRLWRHLRADAGAGDLGGDPRLRRVSRGFMAASAASSALLLHLMGCGVRESSPEGGATGDTGGTPPAEDKAAKRAEHHRVQLGIAMDKATLAFSLADPVAAQQVHGTALRPLPFLTAERQELLTAFRSAERESADVDGSLLSIEEEVGLRLLRFGLDRLRDGLEREPIERTDATKLPSDLIRLVAEIEFIYDDGRTLDAPVLVALARSVSDASAEADLLLTAASPQNLRAGAEDWRVLAKRLRALPQRVGQALADEGTLEAAAAACEARAEDWAKDADALASAPTWQRTTPAPLIGEAATPTAPRVALPDVVGRETLMRWLLVEEGLSETPEELITLAKANHERFGMMRDALATPVAEGALPRAPVDAARCEMIAGPLWKVAQEGGLVPADRPLDCTPLVRAFDARQVDDVELAFQVVDQLVTAPSFRAARKENTAAIGLVGGHIAGATQVHMRRIMLFSAARQDEATRRALETAREGLCGSIAALAYHGQISDTDTWPWVDTQCTQRSIEEWRAAAQARPRAMLGPLGFVELGSEPHRGAALDHYAWAPLGFVFLLGNPDEARKPVDTGNSPMAPPVEVKIEEL